uniref:Putative ubiquitin-like protein 7 n=1 Tax=Culex tarsalis TaxID=7177 RepID=A0A1Q3F451_CULTA
MPFVYLGVHLPFKSYRKIKVDNFDLSNKTEQLREEARKAISELPAEEFDFIYCGDLLQNDDVLQEKGIENGSVVHLIQKKKDLPALPQVDNFTEADVQQVLGIWRTVDPSNFQKVRHPEFMKNVLDANPAIRQDLWALSILKDPILLSSMQQPETIRRVAEKHYILIKASRSIVQLLNSKMISKSTTFSPTIESALEDALSDSSSSEDNTSPTTSVRSARRITADQLASALAFAGSSYNSLNSISQRDADSRTTTDPTNQPSTSGSAPASNRITSSMFMNALSEVIQSQRQRSTEPNSNEPEPMDTSPASAAATVATSAPPAAAPGDMGAQTMSQHSTLEASLSQYRTELDQMREMGLTDTETNLQALIVCNGNVETAVNLVFSGMNN